MISRHRFFSAFYLVILILNIYAFASDNLFIKLVSMPLVGVSLMLYLIIKTQVETQFHKLILTGLTLSMAGDIQLLFAGEAEIYLLTALVATVLGYIFYGIAYYTDYKRIPTGPKRYGHRYALIIFISSGVFFFSAWNDLDDFKYPGIFYFGALLAMITLAGYRFKRVNDLSFKLILTGSFSFGISDLAIGYHNFIDKSGINFVIFVVTYLLAQYFVVIGAIERKEVASY